MIIENKTPKDVEVQKQIVRELHKRPQMPIEILAGILGVKDHQYVQKLVDDLEYMGSIANRISASFLTEAESTTIQQIQEEIRKRLGEDKIKNISINELERMLESAMERKKLVETSKPRQQQGTDNKSYIDQLIKSTSTKDESVSQ